MVELLRLANGVNRQAFNAMYVRNVWCEHWQVAAGASALSINITTWRARKAPLPGSRRELPGREGTTKLTIQLLASKSTAKAMQTAVMSRTGAPIDPLDLDQFPIDTVPYVDQQSDNGPLYHSKLQQIDPATFTSSPEGSNLQILQPSQAPRHCSGRPELNSHNTYPRS